MFHVAYLATHPIQYQAPLLRLLAACPELRLQVFFLSDFSVRTHYEASFNRSIQWDVPLTEGYSSELLSRWLIGPCTTLRSHWPVRGIKTKLRKGHFDALWVHGWGHIGLRQAVNAAHALGVPVLLRGESTPDSSLRRGLRRRLRDALCRRLFARCAGFLCIGSLNRQFYRSFGVPEKQMFSVPYAVDNAWFQTRCAEAAPRREALRSELGLAPARPIILFAAKFIPVKAPRDLLAAYLQAFRPEDPARPYLLFVGDGPLRAQLETQAGERAGNDVRFIGFRNQSELPAFYELCDVFVLPSHFEPWGLVVNEVMNASKPVIVSDRVGAAYDLVEPGANGWIFPAGNVEALAKILRKATIDSKQRGLMGARSLARINEWDFAEDTRGLLAALQAVIFRLDQGTR
jgi:glycosyltransferase involved in cell wall biosynthesis